jgi:hypothetical protein
MVLGPLALAVTGTVANQIGARRAKRRQRRNLAAWGRERGELMKQLEGNAWEAEQGRQATTSRTIGGLLEAQREPEGEPAAVTAESVGGMPAEDDGSMASVARRNALSRDMGLANADLAAQDASMRRTATGRRMGAAQFNAGIPQSAARVELDRRRYLLRKQLAELDTRYGMTANEIPNDALAWQMAGGLANAGARLGFQSAARA